MRYPYSSIVRNAPCSELCQLPVMVFVSLNSCLSSAVFSFASIGLVLVSALVSTGFVVLFSLGVLVSTLVTVFSAGFGVLFFSSFFTTTSVLVLFFSLLKLVLVMLNLFTVKRNAATTIASATNTNKNFVKRLVLSFFFLLFAPFLCWFVLFPFFAVAMINLF